MPRVLVADPIAQEGIDLLQTQTQVDVKAGLGTQGLLPLIGDYEGLIVRSETQVTADLIVAGRNLQVIGRAGVGVDNIDLDAATQHGIAVVNAPTGNTVAAAEHTLALMLALARNVPQAHQSLRGGQWHRSAFMGVEVRNKTLGIVGLGKVGSEVARRAQSFYMRLLGHDPYVSPEYARLLGVELVTLDRLLAESDFVTIHTPLTDSTHPLLGTEELARMKPGARLINCARGGLVDEDALVQAIESGHLAGAALDVFSQEPLTESPLFQHDRIIVTPHLGASTAEAQAEVAQEVAEQVLAVLQGQPARYTVNAPYIPPETHAVLAPYIPVADYAGRLASQLCDGQLTTISLRYEGEIAQHDDAILKAAALMGILGPVSEERVNLVNAALIATQRGLQVVEQKSTAIEQYSSLVTVELATTGGTIVVSGTSMRDQAHIVRVNDDWIDIVPFGGYMLFTDHQDRPGMIGAVGTITGKHDINISFMEVGRLAPRGRATMVLGLDDPIPEAVLAEIRAIPGVDSARVVKL